MPLEIKVGHRYRTRSGGVVEITGNDGHFLWPFVGVNTDGEITCFSKDGSWNVGEESQKDLIKELPAYDEHGLTADDYYTGISYPNG